jgi:copper homeostasis protein
MSSLNENRGILLEVIVSSLDDARAAAAGGADRFEMCVALALGGLTPSLGLLAAVKRQVPHVPAMFMLRPREAGMAYTDADLSVMQRDAELALEQGADGLVFGVLTDRGEVHRAACDRLLRVARQRPNVQTVFHRAFDVVADPLAALEQLIDLGFTRVLTSGRAPLAVKGLDEIRRTRERAGERIEVLPGGGIDQTNVTQVVEATGVNQVHLSLTRAAPDTSTAANLVVRFAVDQPPNESEYRSTDEQAVRAVRGILDGMRYRAGAVARQV